MQKTLFTLLFAAALPAWAANPAVNQAELANAQMQYQALVNAKSNGQNELLKLQERLYAAEQRLLSTQLEVQRLRAELLLMQDIQQKNNGELQNAGERLDKAWRAVYGR